MILRNGFWARYCLEDFEWYNQSISKIAYPMVCFCDIPLTRAHFHMEFYGQFGLGMSREWAYRNGLNPIIYLAKRSPLRKNFLFLASKRQHDQAELDNFFDILSMIKPTQGKMQKKNSSIEVLKDFTQESEWRFIPPLPPGKRAIPYDEYLAKRDFHNDKVRKEGMLAFDLCDINFIFVDNDVSTLKLIDFIDVELSLRFSKQDINLLKSRIFTYERLICDF